MAANQMKDNKAPGNGDLSRDIFKIGGEEINKQLVIPYDHILSKQKILMKWKPKSYYYTKRRQTRRQKLKTNQFFVI